MKTVKMKMGISLTMTTMTMIKLKTMKTVQTTTPTTMITMTKTCRIRPNTWKCPLLNFLPMRTAQGQAPTSASVPPTIFSPGAGPRTDNKRIASGATILEIGGTTPHDIFGAPVVVVVDVVVVVVVVGEVVVAVVVVVVVVVVVEVVMVVVVVVDVVVVVPVLLEVEVAVVDSVVVEMLGSAQQRVKSKSSKPQGKLMALMR